ncbi:hypothetical protein [Brevundimonas sp.]|uniref:hypothetical protein n=1 Tax=Brevundimonas sp. TaxID=1871086 RepID=UPI002737F619|nr:hypothetical protein [Brevundimonas sp.]
MARRLRAQSIMTQVRNAIVRIFSNLPKAPASEAGQKTRVGWQALPGAALMEGPQCR